MTTHPPSRELTREEHEIFARALMRATKGVITLKHVTTDDRAFDNLDQARQHQRMIDKIARWMVVEDIPESRHKLMLARILSWVEFDEQTADEPEGKA